MSASRCSLDDSDRLLLRWSEDAFLPLREEFVQMLEARNSEAVICSARRLLEKTKVSLIGKNSIETGVVRSCRAFGEKFIVTILINGQGPTGPEIDPGVLLIDSFMTEEQELSILDELDDEVRRQQFRSLAVAKAYLNTGRCEGTAALNRLFKFTVRSSTALVPNGVVQFWGKFRHAAGTCAFARAESNPKLIGTNGTIAPSPECPGAVSSPVQ
jgi:hypothetical protein